MEGGSGVAFKLIDVFLKALELGEEFAIRGDTVDDADGIVDVISHRQMVTGVFDGAHMPRSDVASGTNESEIFHFGFCKLQPKNSETLGSQRMAIEDTLEVANDRLMLGLAVRHQ